jgi:hypothetical protein
LELFHQCGILVVVHFNHIRSSHIPVVIKWFLTFIYLSTISDNKATHKDN